MSLNPEFIPWLRGQVQEYADNYDCAENRAFPAWVLAYIHDADEDLAFNQTDTLSQGDAGLDGWYYDREAQVFHLIQAKYSEDPNAVIAPGSVDSLIKVASYLKNPDSISDGPYKEKLTDIALQLQQAMNDGASVSLDLYLASKMSDGAKKVFEESVANLGQNFLATIYDIQKLNDIKLSDDPISDLKSQQVDFPLSRETAFFESTDSNIPGVSKAAVATLDGRGLADAVSAWQARLFHGNVRYYLRRSNRINKGMLQTLDSSDGKKSFWLFNNGLTIVADSFEFSQGKLKAENPQIVNGAQTSSVLRDCRAKIATGEVSVQCRVIAINANQEGQLALQRISEYTNSQSPVKISDLRSNTKRHRDIQQSFGMLPEPVFYERRRGEWKSLDSAGQRKFCSRVVSKENVGQRYLAFIGKPAEAVAKKEDIFGDLESIAFDPSVSAHVFMLAHELYEQADHLMKASAASELVGLVPGLKNKASSDQTEDSPTQLDAIRRARGLICVYATALAKDALQWRYGSIGPTRAKAIRGAMQLTSGAIYKFVWRYSFRAIRTWYAALPDKSALKAQLQKSETIDSLRAALQDALSDCDRDAVPALEI